VSPFWLAALRNKQLDLPWEDLGSLVQTVELLQFEGHTYGEKLFLTLTCTKTGYELSSSEASRFNEFDLSSLPDLPRYSKPAEFVFSKSASVRAKEQSGSLKLRKFRLCV
jgi:hypothetical protein